ncbi:MAG TPA: acyl carrier protein [Candidatus Limnocylindrales bacterium]|nr:acyl carrier protein [Candidatus Limnocylindrales bacterium]
MTSAVEDKVREFVIDYFYVTDARSLTNDQSLIDSDLVDSTGMMGIILFLETEFGITMADDETTPDNLDSIDRIVAYVERKRPSPPG